MESRKGETKEEDHVVRRLVPLTTWSREQWASHLDLSVWWNKLPATIPYSTLSTDVTSKASLSPPLVLSLPSSPLPSIHLCPYFSSCSPHRLSLPFSLWVSVLSVSDTQWIREYLAARYQTSLHLPLPLCAQAYQSESHCQDRCHRRNCNHWHNLHLPQHADYTQLEPINGNQRRVRAKVYSHVWRIMTCFTRELLQSFTDVSYFFCKTRAIKLQWQQFPSKTTTMQQTTVFVWQTELTATRTYLNRRQLQDQHLKMKVTKVKSHNRVSQKLLYNQKLHIHGFITCTLYTKIHHMTFNVQ